MTFHNAKPVIYPNLESMISSHGLNYTTFGALIGMSRDSVSRRMTGKTAFSVEEAKKIKRLFNKPLDFLFASKASVEVA